MKTSDNTIIKVVIPRWVQTELQGVDISKILIDYCKPLTMKQIACVKCLSVKCKDCDNDNEDSLYESKPIQIPNDLFANAPEHIVKKTGMKTRRDELIINEACKDCHEEHPCGGFCNENP